MTPTFTPGSDLFGSWFRDVVDGKPPTRFKLPDPFAALDIRPGQVVLFGGAPGGGKTAALMQIGIDLLRQNDGARLLVANVEMTPARLAERIASRISAVPLKAIRDRTLTPEQMTRVRVAVDALAPVAGRLAFLAPPYTLEHVAAAGTAFSANVLVLDYIQRFTVGESKDRREQLEDAATKLRHFGDIGAAVLVASAVARQRGNTGSSYDGLNLASFRGSSELEFGCDSAYILQPDESGRVTFHCHKNRDDQMADLPTAFDGAIQTFSPVRSGLGGFDAASPAVTTRKDRRGGLS